MKTLAQLKIEKQEHDIRIGLLESQLNGLKKSSKLAEQEYIKLRRDKGRTERDLRQAKKRREQIRKRIQTLPSQVRSWGKNNPGELINSVMKT
jgi:chromosome segregation ATPase